MPISLLADGGLIFLAFATGLIGQHFADEVNNRQLALAAFIITFTIPTMVGALLIFATLATLQWWNSPMLTGIAWVISWLVMSRH